MLNLASLLSNTRPATQGPQGANTRAATADGATPRATAGATFAAAMQRQQAQQAQQALGLGAAAPARHTPPSHSGPATATAPAASLSPKPPAQAHSDQPVSAPAPAPAPEPAPQPRSEAKAAPAAPQNGDRSGAPEPRGPSGTADTSGPAPAGDDAPSTQGAGLPPDPHSTTRQLARRAAAQAQAQRPDTATPSATAAADQALQAGALADQPPGDALAPTLPDSTPMDWLAQSLAWQPSASHSVTGLPGLAASADANGAADTAMALSGSAPAMGTSALARPLDTLPARTATDPSEHGPRGLSTTVLAAGRQSTVLEVPGVRPGPGQTADQDLAATAGAETGRGAAMPGRPAAALDRAVEPRSTAERQNPRDARLAADSTVTSTQLVGQQPAAPTTPREKPEPVATSLPASPGASLPSGMAAASGAGFAGTGQGRGGQGMADGASPRAMGAAEAQPGLATPSVTLPTPGNVPAGTSAAASPARAEATIAVPVQDPGFGLALGSQVSLLVKDGITEARLQLHPAEMGPISVQISVDGSSAQVNFQADMAATRAALESSLPALASALQDAGLTLSGGGVFQQSPQGQGQGQGQAQGQAASAQAQASGRGTTGPDSVESGANGLGQAPARQARGLVDLVA